MLFWELYGRQAAIENARWKYLLEQDGTARLYDLQADPTETADLAATRPKKLRSLAQKYQRWADANNVMPLEDVREARRARQKGKDKKEKRKQRAASTSCP